MRGPSLDRASNAGANDDWHLVSRGDGESSDGSERSAGSMFMHGGMSRPETPAASLVGDVHEVGSDGPPTPESELLADSVLCAPFGSAAGCSGAAGPSGSQNEALKASEGCGDDEVVGLHCLQGLSQEGPLEGFANSPPIGPTPAARSTLRTTSPPPPAAGSTAKAERVRVVIGLDGDGVLVGLEGEEDDEAEEGDVAAALAMAEDGHMDVLDVLGELLDGLGWTGTCLMDAWRAGVAEVSAELTQLQAAMLRQASGVAASVAATHEAALVSTRKLLLRLTAGATPSLLISALGITTLATLAGLVFFMGRCRSLSTRLAARDRELARLVVKVLNLQEALQQPRLSGPVLRHTSLLSGLVATSLM